MTAETRPSAFARALTWLVVALTVVLLVLGAARYGWSMQVHERFWQDIADRTRGPITFRFILQPSMALLAALPDGVKDARLGHKAFFWTTLRDPTQHGGRLREGLKSIARVMLLGISMDVIYQYKVFERFYPAEAVMMALLLAVIPYFILRWLTERIANWWFARKRSGSSS